MQFAYPLTRETADGREVWKRPDDMTLDELRQALRVLEARRGQKYAQKAAALRAYAAQHYPGEFSSLPTVRDASCTFEVEDGD